ncbi:MAG: hypothetical protein ETSY2_49750 [Candidatus Entotheonella gemina]|uniref:ATPase AAA-type core domain-containing protein n=1 Tax=Candidatus Entotheonella gemina TaxID=1429439 RepID=W4LAY2_9BACT|nr:MAG: hypothetical protein ETSY2_49750 [Candidatus Entotheonella gemina]
MLRDITIENYRLYKHFHMEGMNRINLLIGANNSGKSSLLEAIYILVNYEPLIAISNTLDMRFFIRPHSKNNVSLSAFIENFDISDIFHDYDRNKQILINSKLISSLNIDYNTGKSISRDPYIIINKRDKNGQETTGVTTIPELLESLKKYSKNSNKALARNYFVTPYRLDQEIISELWGQIVLTTKEDMILSAMRILEPNLERMAFLNLMSLEFSVKLKLKDNPMPVPLGSMGDGIYRILALIITLVNCENGVLLIDEIDAGLHYSALTKMWKLVIETARQLNVQVFATTHSWDALAAFHKAMAETETPELGTVFRLERKHDQIQYVSYTGEELAVAVEHDIEVR